jgi:molecular chaperone GrpE
MKDKKQDKKSQPNVEIPASDADDQKDKIEITVEADDIAAKLTELTEENDRLRDQALRARAEFENFRRRKNRELEEYTSLANESLIEDLLPVLDDLGLLLSNSEENKEVAALIDGARLIQQKFSDTLKKRGLAEVEAEGKPFDPEVHEALLETPSPDAEPGTVISVHQTGYKLGNKLLRASRVIIAAAAQDQEG